MNTHQDGAERLSPAAVAAWALLSALGCAFGLATALLLNVPLMVLLTPGGALVVLGGLIGLAVGGAQWWVLREHQIAARWWVLSSALGAIGGLLAGFALARASGNFGFLNLWDTALVGGGIGVAQWLILRRSIRQAGWWVLASTLGWGIALWGRSGGPPGALISVCVAALAYGMSTGLVFARISAPRHRRQ